MNEYVILSGIVGSTAYGLNHPDSDVDRLGVFVVPTYHLHGLRQPTESVVKTNPDVTLHEVRKYVSLCLKCNPSVTELMWLPENLYEAKDRWGRQLVNMRQDFLSERLVRNAYLGYATSQFSRLLGRGDGSFSSDTRKRTAKHARHLRRLLHQGLELYQSANLTVEIPADERQAYFDFGEAVAQDPEVARKELAAAEEAFDAVKSPLPAEPDFNEVERFLYELRDGDPASVTERPRRRRADAGA